MDAARFDRLTRSLTTASRRGLLTSLSAALGLSLLHGPGFV